jgi:hypothetical protein
VEREVHVTSPELTRRGRRGEAPRPLLLRGPADWPTLADGSFRIDGVRVQPSVSGRAGRHPWSFTGPSIWPANLARTDIELASSRSRRIGSPASSRPGRGRLCPTARCYRAAARLDLLGRVPHRKGRASSTASR